MRWRPTRACLPHDLKTITDQPLIKIKADCVCPTESGSGRLFHVYAAARRIVWFLDMSQGSAPAYATVTRRVQGTGDADPSTLYRSEHALLRIVCTTATRSVMHDAPIPGFVTNNPSVAELVMNDPLVTPIITEMPATWSNDVLAARLGILAARFRALATRLGTIGTLGFGRSFVRSMRGLARLVATLCQFAANQRFNPVKPLAKVSLKAIKLVAKGLDLALQSPER